MIIKSIDIFYRGTFSITVIVIGNGIDDLSSNVFTSLHGNALGKGMNPSIPLQLTNVLVCKNEFILSFLPLCSVLVHHGYANANIFPWRVKVN